jgi:hypothetical protein
MSRASVFIRPSVLSLISVEKLLVVLMSLALVYCSGGPVEDSAAPGVQVGCAQDLTPEQCAEGKEKAQAALASQDFSQRAFKKILVGTASSETDPLSLELAVPYNWSVEDMADHMAGQLNLSVSAEALIFEVHKGRALFAQNHGVEVFTTAFDFGFQEELEVLQALESFMPSIRETAPDIINIIVEKKSGPPQIEGQSLRLQYPFAPNLVETLKKGIPRVPAKANSQFI